MYHTLLECKYADYLFLDSIYYVSFILFFFWNPTFLRLFKLGPLLSFSFFFFFLNSKNVFCNVCTCSFQKLIFWGASIPLSGNGDPGWCSSRLGALAQKESFRCLVPGARTGPFTHSVAQCCGAVCLPVPAVGSHLVVWLIVEPQD